MFQIKIHILFCFSYPINHNHDRLLSFYKTLKSHSNFEVSLNFLYFLIAGAAVDMLKRHLISAAVSAFYPINMSIMVSVYTNRCPHWMLKHFLIHEFHMKLRHKFIIPINNVIKCHQNYQINGIMCHYAMSSGSNHLSSFPDKRSISLIHL